MHTIKKLKAIYPVITGENNPILRKISTAITDITPEIEEFWYNLLDLMWEYDGVGLAAPQLGQNIRMCAITSWKTTKKGKENTWEEILINPEIIDHSETMNKDLEACLSLPNMEGEVMRYDWIVVKYTTLNGKKKTKKVKWFNARIIQHEMDHLDGIMFIDKLERK